MRIQKTRLLALCAITIALSAAMVWLPFVFFVPVFVAITLVDIRLSIFSSASYGVISFLKALTGGSIVATGFVANPAIPIVPRILVGIIAHYVYIGTYKASKNRLISASVMAGVGSLSNTILVVTALVFLVPKNVYLGQDIFALVPVLLTQGVIEFFVNIIVVGAISTVLYKSKIVDKLILHKNIGYAKDNFNENIDVGCISKNENNNVSKNDDMYVENNLINIKDNDENI